MEPTAPSSSSTNEENGAPYALQLAAWAGALLIVLLSLWQRVSFSTGWFCFIFALFCGGGLWWDLQTNSEHERKHRPFISPFLFALTVFGFLWTLFHAWGVGLSPWYAAGPLLPYSDAGEYVNGARSLITFGELGEISARRPLGTTFIAVPLWATHQNYQWTLIWLVLATAVATFFAVRQTWLSGGLLAALLFLGLCLSVFFEWSCVFMTERAGFLFAALSCALLLSAFRRRRFWESVAGVGLLVLAQAARPSAILVIVAAGGYAVYFFSKGKKEALQKGITMAVVIVVLLVIDSLISIRLGPKEAEYQGNIGFSLYGLAAGGKPWNYVLSEHPELYQLPSDGDRSRVVYSLLWQRLRTHPEVLVGAVLQKFWNAIRYPADVFFGLINGIPRTLVTLLACLGFVLTVRLTIRKSTAWAFLPPVALGVLFSAPFLFDGGTRIYMSIVPFHLALAVIPIAMGVDWWRKTRSERRANFPEETPDPAPTGEIVFAISLFAVLTLLPIYISASAHPQAISAALQKSGLSSDEGAFYFNRQSGVLLGAERPPGDVLNVPFESLIKAGHFGTDFDLSSYVARRDFLCQTLMLAAPSGHEDVIASYIVFDRVPEGAPGYLIVRLRLLQQKAGTAVFKAEDFRKLEL